MKAESPTAAPRCSGFLFGLGIMPYFNQLLDRDKLSGARRRPDEAKSFREAIQNWKGITRLNAPVKVTPVQRLRRPNLNLEIKRPPVNNPPKLGHAMTASGGR
jgi:hypothetical protein